MENQRICRADRSPASSRAGALGQAQRLHHHLDAERGPMVFFRDQQAVEPLMTCLTVPHRKVRRIAAHALGVLQDQRAIQPLIDRLRDRAYDVRMSAANSLGQLNAVQAVGALIPLITHRNQNLRWAALTALVEIDDPHALKVFVEALICDDADARMLARSALGRAWHREDVRRRLRAHADPRVHVLLDEQELEAQERWSASERPKSDV